MSKVKPTRAHRNITWIERNCFVPEGKLVGTPVRLRPWQRDILVGIYDSPTRRAIISFSRKAGKGLAVDTPIPTPGGWRTMADLQAGDMVFGSEGQPTRVTDVSDVHTGLRCWKLTFSDGSSIVADEEHQWLTRHAYRPWANARRNGSGNGGDDRIEVVTTPQIAQSVHRPRADGAMESNHKLNVAPPLISPDIDLPIDPYILGLWLGDGTSSNAQFTIGDQDLEHYCTSLIEAGYPAKRRLGPTAWNISATGTHQEPGTLQATLRRIDVLNNKHIPENYHNAGTAQRLALLQGLMDSDGYATLQRKTPQCQFVSTRQVLAYGVWRLMRSLGIKGHVREGVTKLYGRVVGTDYSISFNASRSEAVFRLPRKLALLPESFTARCKTLTIVACDEVPSVPTRCIAVEAPDRLYLAGHGCVPTHNTSLSAMLVLLHLCGPEARPNSQIVSAAQSREQAAVLFQLAAKMIRMNNNLLQFVQIRETIKQLICPEIGSSYRALSADASTSMGLSPVLVVHDEAGQVKGPRSPLFDALETACAAHENPLTICISTQAATDSDLFSILIDDAKTQADPRVKLFLYTASDDLDPFSDEALLAANPAFGDFANATEIRAMAADAKRMPSRENEFRQLILNQRCEAVSPFISKTVWDSNGGAVAPSFEGYPVYAGLDLSEVADLCCLTLVAKIDGKWHVKPTFWLPSEGLTEKSRQDRTPWDLWAKQGHLNTTPGKAIEYSFVAAHLFNLYQSLDIRTLHFDRWNMRHLKPWLLEAGFTEPMLERFIEFGQGYQSMSPALRHLETVLLSDGIAHGQHPIMTMCMANAVIESDPAGNRKLSKKKSRSRIDGSVALAMAMAGTTLATDKPFVSIWDLPADVEPANEMADA